VRVEWRFVEATNVQTALTLCRIQIPRAWILYESRSWYSDGLRVRVPIIITIISSCCPLCRSKGLPRSFSIYFCPLPTISPLGPRINNIPSVRFLLREVSCLPTAPECSGGTATYRLSTCVFHFVWHLPFDLFGLGGPTSSYATADIALRVIGAHKPHHHKVETHGGDVSINTLIFLS
jgi:hypothetical protein